jgi:hypothetical protein
MWDGRGWLLWEVQSSKFKVIPLVPKLSLGTQIGAKLGFAVGA